MKHTILLLLTAVLISGQSFAQGFVKGVKYRIENNFDTKKWGRHGTIGLGAPRGADTNTYYVTDGNITADCWWYIEEVENATFTIRNASTGKYITWKKKNEDFDLTDEPTKYSMWRIKEENGMLIIFLNGGEPQFMGFSKSAKSEEPTARFVSAKRREGTTPYEYFIFYDDKGKAVNPADVPSYDYAKATPSIPSQSSDIKKYATDICINGKPIAYASDKKFWLSTVPNGPIVITGKPVGSDATFELKDGDVTITNSKQLKLRKAYQLITSSKGKVVVTSTLYFTSMPLLDIRHEGSMGVGMSDYNWGEIVLTSCESSIPVRLNARFRTRGATASKQGKHALNMKVRELGTDAEVDTALLGMRSSGSWILDAAAVDYTKMRNRVSFDIWNSFSKLPYDSQFGGRNGTEGRFMEVIINGVYSGIYCMTDKINRKLLNLKKFDKDNNITRGVSYKCTYLTKFEEYEVRTFLSNYGDTRATGSFFCDWELKEPDGRPSVEAWKPLYDLFYNAGNVQYCKEHFYIDNVIDYHLFVLALLIIDNGNKNEFMSVKSVVSDDPDHQRLFFTPWDLDTALGGDANSINKDGHYTETNAQVISEQNINQCYPFKALIKDPDYYARIKARWMEARKNEFSLYNVTKRMTDYAKYFIENGAYEREKNAKGTQVVENIMKEVEYISQWYATQINAMDDYFGVSHVPQTSSVDNIAPDLRESVTYDLSGRKVINPQKGLLIRDGKKVVVR